LQFKSLKNFYAKYLLAIGSIVGGYLVFFLLLKFTNYKFFCFFKTITGIPCPGCGMGKAAREIFKGNFIASIYHNILSIPFTIAVVISIVWLAVDLIRRKETFFPFINSKIKLPYKILLFVLLFVSWGVNLVLYYS